MKKVLLFIVLLLGTSTINAQVRKETFRYVFVVNAGMAGISGNEALKNAQLVTSNGATIFFDKPKELITIKIHLPEKTDTFKIEKVSKEGNNSSYLCTGTNGQGKAMVIEYKKEDCIMIGFDKIGAIFLFTDLNKEQMFDLY